MYRGEWFRQNASGIMYLGRNQLETNIQGKDMKRRIDCHTIIYLDLFKLCLDEF